MREASITRAAPQEKQKAFCEGWSWDRSARRVDPQEDIDRRLPTPVRVVSNTIAHILTRTQPEVPATNVCASAERMWLYRRSRSAAL